MALTASEEALVRQLLEQQAAILSLAGNESTITSKLGATKVTLADLASASSISELDLLLTRQGTTDRSATAERLKEYISPQATEEIQGIVELATPAEAVAGTDPSRVITPATLAQVLSIALIPTGSVIFVSNNTAPTGYMKANGALISRTIYSSLFDAIGTTFGEGDGSTTFALPDLRGEFLRGWDDGRGVDTGRAFGSAQLDQMQRLTGALIFSPGVINSASGAFTESGTTTQGANSGTNTRSTTGNFDSGNSPNARVSADTTGETRSRNVALLACIKF